ncbi:GNAT family N-acetyltransferase [Dongia sedimenti]|uniref:GNAT family N-acetyltransferase n=1 Tax=Dongia sedimenti TaxID=3064282 RepID=A0ABU0YL01_9PROT|nr:GNAT family N-acetyltransferase [Rhodospirillaceae bacterium R-7]
MTPPIIETPRLILRRLANYDAPALHAMLSDAETMRYWSSLPHVDLAETEAWVAESVAATARGDAHDFAVLRDGRLVGRVAFWMGNEIGFLFHRDVWGQGVAREAVGALLRHGFETLRFTSVRADVDPDNQRSLALLERLGFRRTGFAERTFKIGENWVDSVYLELPASDFVAN